MSTGKVEKYPREDDKFLLAFLRARKYDVPRACELVNNFAHFWYSKRDLIEGLCAAKCRAFVELGMMKFLKVRSDLWVCKSDCWKAMHPTQSAC